MVEILPNWHPIVVHFAIALLLTSSALFVAGSVGAARPFGRAATITARLNLGLGVLAALAALATGWQAFNSVPHDDASHANMVVHLRWAVASVALFAVAAFVAWRDRDRAAGASVALLAALVLGAGALGVTGWLGGENVYRFGLGVLSLPQAHHHNHDGPHHPDDKGADADDPARGPRGNDGAH